MEDNAKFPYKKVIIAISSFVVVALISASSYLTLHMGMFTVEMIELKGNKRITQREILKRSGLKEGQSSIFFFENQVEDDIQKNPWIKKVSVRKEFPKKVTIEVEEEEVYCIVLSDGGKPLYMSRTGRILGSGNFDLGLDFPVLIGDGIGDPKLLEEALEILELSKNSTVLKWDDISEVQLNSVYGITVFTNDSRRIEFDRDNIIEKWDKAERIMRYSRSLGLEESYINVSSGSMGVVDFKHRAAKPGATDG
ncbi:MAG TPA: FtsQ-type POTRA domain-containing protein [Thermodesulfobacteriota bacterium]|nr:FtsQ-type POTRA domain-containing protein [Thermodesulfobacteriota bacterium]